MNKCSDFLNEVNQPSASSRSSPGRALGHSILRNHCHASQVTADTADTVSCDRLVAEHVPKEYDDIRVSYFRIVCGLVSIKSKGRWTRAERLHLTNAFAASIKRASIEVEPGELSALLASIWAGVKFGGSDIFQRSWDASSRMPCPKCAMSLGPRIQRLAAWCCELNKECEGKFIMPCRTAAKFFGIPHRQAATWIRLLVDHGILTIVEKPIERTVKGYRYRFVGQI